MNSVVRKKLLMADDDVNSTAAVALFFEAQTSKCAPGGQRSALWLLMKRSRIGRMGTVGIFVGVTLSVEPSAPSVAISRSGVVWGHRSVVCPAHRPETREDWNPRPAVRPDVNVTAKGAPSSTF